MHFAFGMPVIIATRTASGRNADGSRTTTLTYTPIDGAAFAPGGSVETVGGQDTVVAQPRLLLPPGSPVPAPTDFVIIGGAFIDENTVEGGEQYEIAGDAVPWASPFTGWTPGVELPLQRISG